MACLDVQDTLAIISPKGRLSQYLKEFEPRPQQLKMMEDVIKSYNEDAIALIEAGTGTGKSVAYLIPAILWALKQKERTLISTNTIALQEQLILKDIPLVSKTMGAEIKAVIVKGMSNYLCLRKLEEAVMERALYTEDEAAEIEKIDQWEKNATMASRSDLPFSPSGTTWERVAAENDTCTHKKCPHFQKCHFFKARQEAADAQILVSNHHMLFADLSVRQKSEGNQKDPGLLPNYRHVILDEAHHIEDVATEFLAGRTSHFEIRRHLARLSSERHGRLGALYQLVRKHLTKHSMKGVDSVCRRLEIDLPGMRTQLLEAIQGTFDVLYLFVEQLSDKKGEEELRGTSKLRFRPHHRDHPVWHQVVQEGNALVTLLKQYVQCLVSVHQDVTHLEYPPFQDQAAGVCQEILALANRLLVSASVLEQFMQGEEESHKVKWIEAKPYQHWTNIILIDAELEVSRILPDILFNPFASVTLCSATLATNQTFDFIKERLGITQEHLGNKKIIEQIYGSPFNYQKQVLLVVPTDVPLPSHPHFTHNACEKIWHALHASRGNAFVLFTSYTMLNSCHEQLHDHLTKRGYTLYKQGDDHRHVLLKQFRKAPRAVLFGTSSFWEGVDVTGEDLRLVIIVKLPFQVPTEPIIEARTESIAQKGGSPFLDYAVPNAIVKFKQGFGRLIRHKKDRGCIVCLDSRLHTKSYGKQFLNSLPNCQQTFADSQTIHQQMLDFYKNFS